MRPTLIPVIIMLASCAPSATIPVAEGFLWMEGEWVSEDGTFGEDWTYYDMEDRLEGTGWRVEGSDTIRTETMQVLHRRGTLFFMAMPAGKGPVYFEIVDAQPNRFLSRNPFNEYPKQIEYILEDNHLSAMITDGSKTETFIFYRRQD